MKSTLSSQEYVIKGLYGGTFNTHNQAEKHARKIANKLRKPITYTAYVTVFQAGGERSSVKEYTIQPA
jgi:hypothetical protein